MSHTYQEQREIRALGQRQASARHAAGAARFEIQSNASDVDSNVVDMTTRRRMGRAGVRDQMILPRQEVALPAETVATAVIASMAPVVNPVIGEKAPTFEHLEREAAIEEALAQAYAEAKPSSDRSEFPAFLDNHSRLKIAA